MPEGDTIHKIANFLKPRLDGAVVEEVSLARRFGGELGRRGRAVYRDGFAPVAVRAVEARGKHLFIEFDDDRALRSHLGMYGSWHFYRPGAEWQRPLEQASLILRTADTVYVCFNAKEVEWVRVPSVRERLIDLRLGPDLTTGEVDADAVVRRIREFMAPDAPLVDVLLDQRVACGIGNVYKCELLFIQRLAPLMAVGQLGDPALARTFTLAAELLSSNLGGGKRVTRREPDNAGRLWVYGRGGAPCLRCDDTIRYARLGQHHRGTYWCPSCQD